MLSNFIIKYMMNTNSKLSILPIEPKAPRCLMEFLFTIPKTSKIASHSTNISGCFGEGGLSPPAPTLALPLLVG